MKNGNYPFHLSDLSVSVSVLVERGDVDELGGVLNLFQLKTP